MTYNHLAVPELSHVIAAKCPGPDCGEEIFAHEPYVFCDELGCYMHTECHDKWKEER